MYIDNVLGSVDIQMPIWETATDTQIWQTWLAVNSHASFQISVMKHLLRLIFYVLNVQFAWTMHSVRKHMMFVVFMNFFQPDFVIHSL